MKLMMAVVRGYASVRPSQYLIQGFFDFWLERTANSNSLVMLMGWRRL